MWVTHLRTSVLSIITGGGKWVEITIPMDPLYLSVLAGFHLKSVAIRYIWQLARFYLRFPS
jgi:hypothetical protein